MFEEKHLPLPLKQILLWKGEIWFVKSYLLFFCNCKGIFNKVRFFSQKLGEKTPKIQKSKIIITAILS